MFKHALTHDVAYASLLKERRRELHGRVGDAIAHLYGDRLPSSTRSWPRISNGRNAGPTRRATYAGRGEIHGGVRRAGGRRVQRSCP